jgi:hypothetical protein
MFVSLSTITFENAFIKSLSESSTSGALISSGVSDIFNPADGKINSGDFYAPGDARIPTGQKPITTRYGKVRTKRKKKKRSRTLAAKKSE